MKTIDCLCFGACVVDELSDTQFRNLGGDAANQAMILKKLNMNALLCACIGQDEAGQFIKDQLKEVKIPCFTLIERNDCTTTLSKITLDKNKERSFEVSGYAHRMLKKEDFPIKLLPECRALSLGSMFSLHLLEEDGLLDIFKTAQKNQCLVFTDTSTDRHQKGLKKISEFLPYIDYFMPSYDEAKSLTLKTEVDEIAQTLLDHGAKCVIIKCSNDGAYLYKDNLKLYQKAFDAEVVNTTGAGDNFCAGFIASLLAGKTEEEALMNAAWLGARAVEKHGTTETDLSNLPNPI